MADLLVLGGHKWEDEQRFVCIAHIVSRADRAFRSHRGLVAASGQVELDLINDVVARMSTPSRWEAVPPECRNVALRNKAFKGLASTLCLATYMMNFHQGYPFKIFNLMVNPSDELVSEILADHHLWCDWSRAFIAHWQTEGGLTCSGALLEIRVVLIIAKFDTSAIEAKHAAIRRVLRALCNQSKTPALSTASAMEVLRLFRVYAEKFGNILFPQGADGHGALENQGNDDPEQGPPSKKP
eukprot:6163740-Pyramimonas_sp.AAC.1